MTPDGTVSTIAGVPGKYGFKMEMQKKQPLTFVLGLQLDMMVLYLLQILVTTQSGEYQLMVLFQHLLGVLENLDMLMEMEMMLVLIIHLEYV